MDNLVLIRVAAALDRGLAGAVLRDLHEDSRQRFRLIFDRDAGPATLVISLRAEQPWAGRPAGRRWAGPARQPSSFAATVRRTLRGSRVLRVEKLGPDRLLRISFSADRALVAELATHGANLVLLEANGAVAVAARQPRTTRDRLKPGAAYGAPSIPARLWSPFGRSAGEIDDTLQRRVREGESRFEALRRHLFGVGSEGARLVLEESDSTGRSPGVVLHDRLSGLERGELDPVVATDACGVVERLFPWKPASPPDGCTWQSGTDAAETAGIYHEAVDRRAMEEGRGESLLRLVDREIERLERAGGRARQDLAVFDDPERHRHHGEALLAGISVARRSGPVYFVPDPYSPEGDEIAVPARAGDSAQRTADECFRRYRRARRGREQAGARIERLKGEVERLVGLRDGFDPRGGSSAMETLEAELRRAGLPVGLRAPTKAGRLTAATLPPRLEGVRLLTSSDGLSILVGRSGKDNHRLTFKLSAPDDFWFHAQGCPGAHVVVRNTERLSSPPRATLLEAAAAAAWYSEARRSPQVDVQWTRRKYVRHARGRPPGTVLLKRFETLRVKPALPAD